MPGGTFPVHLRIYTPSFRSKYTKKNSEIRDNDFFFKVALTNSKIYYNGF